MRCMKVLSALVITVVVLGSTGNAEAQCEPDGDVQFACGPISPEDLVVVPDSPWVIVSSMEDDGYLSVIDSRDHSSEVLFPTASSRSEHDRQR